jgi:UDP-N-acetylmuramoylalanine--D-glutamate ligase
VAGAGVRAAVGGNPGTPALELLALDVRHYVLELSSFQPSGPVPTASAVAERHPDHLTSTATWRLHAAKARTAAPSPS